MFYELEKEHSEKDPQNSSDAKGVHDIHKKDTLKRTVLQELIWSGPAPSLSRRPAHEEKLKGEARTTVRTKLPTETP